MNVLRLFWLDVQKLFSIRLMLVFIALPALAAFNGWFVSIAFLVFAYLVPYGMFSYDDTSIAENLYGVLPVRREHMVMARYLFAVLCMLLMAALMLLVNTACALLFSWPMLAANFISALVLGFVGGLTFICVAFPMILHLGAQKANTNVLVLFVLVFISLSFYGDTLLGAQSSGTLGLALFCLLALIISLQTALRLYHKREFYDYVPMKDVHRAKKR